MWIDAYVSGRRYGGYPKEDFKVKVTRENGDVSVTFEDLSGSTEGSFRVTSSVARVLAHALIEASDGHYDEDFKAIAVRNNVALTEQAIAFNDKILEPIDSLWLSKDTCTILKKAKIERVIDLVTMTEDELLEVPKLSAKGVKEIKEKLDGENLPLGFRFGAAE